MAKDLPEAAWARRSTSGSTSGQSSGIFDAGNTAFNSEIWGDAEQLMQAFRRPVYSSVIFKLRDPSTLRGGERTAREATPGSPST